MGYQRVLDIPQNAAVQRAKELLGAEGIVVLCEVDISQKLKERLGIGFYRYLILGACYPRLSCQSLEKEPDHELLLPCNIVVYEHEGRVVVSTIGADKMLSIVGNPQLEIAAKQVNKKLRRVIDSI